MLAHSDEIVLSLASPNVIRGWSYGQIRTPALLDPATQNFHLSGLFSQRTFGPIQDFRCQCGKHSGWTQSTMICEECHVLVTSRSIRQIRMGHIELPVPVLHPWFWGSDDGPVELLLGMSHDDVSRLVSGRMCVDIDQTGASCVNFNLIPVQTDDQDDIPILASASHQTGPEAILQMLTRINFSVRQQLLQEKFRSLATRLSTAQSDQLARRLQLHEAVTAGRLIPAGLVLQALPVLPAGLRGLRLNPQGKLQADRLSAQYQRILRICGQIESFQNAPEATQRTTGVTHRALRCFERRLAREIGRLFTRLSQQGSPIRRGRRPADPPFLAWGDTFDPQWMDVVPDPTLRLYQCRLPPERLAAGVHFPLAPFKLRGSGEHRCDESLPPVLCELRPFTGTCDLVSLQPLLGSDQALHVHPLLLNSAGEPGSRTKARIHIPSLEQARADCDRLSFPQRHFHHPADGSWNLALPREAAVDCFLASWMSDNLQKQRDAWNQSGFDFRHGHPVFNSFAEVVLAWENGRLAIHDLIAINLTPLQSPLWDDGHPPPETPLRRRTTTVGRVLINSCFPQELPFLDALFPYSVVQSRLKEVHQALGPLRAERALESVIERGIQILTRSGLSFSSNDFNAGPKITKILHEFETRRQRLLKIEQRGFICPSELQYSLLACETQAERSAIQAVAEHLWNSSQFSPLWSVAQATGGWKQQQLNPLCGMMGHLATPLKTSVPACVTSNFHRGLRMHEYFWTAAHRRHKELERIQPLSAARRFRRDLVNLARNAVITEEDCGTRNGLLVTPAPPRKEAPRSPSFPELITGRVSAEPVLHPQENSIIVGIDEMISPNDAELISSLEIKQIRIRHPLYCQAASGLCRRCYGVDPQTQLLVEIGAPVGITSALALGELLEQVPLTWNRSEEAPSPAPPYAVSAAEGIVSLKHVGVTINQDGQRIALSTQGTVDILDNQGLTLAQHPVPHGAHIRVAAGDGCREGTSLATWDPDVQQCYSRHAGRVRLLTSSDACFAITVIDEDDRIVDSCFLPNGSRLCVRDQDRVDIGTLLARIPAREPEVHPHAPQGLRRLRQALACCRPAQPARLVDAEGIVRLDIDLRNQVCHIHIDRVRGRRSHHDAAISHSVPLSSAARIRVRTGDVVKAGDQLTDGEMSLHELLRVFGPSVIHKMLTEEWRCCLQAVRSGRQIDDRHLDIIVSQLMRQVRVVSPGDSHLAAGTVLERRKLMEVNNKLRRLIKIDDIHKYPFPLETNTISAELYELMKQQLRRQNPKAEIPPRMIPWLAGWETILTGMNTAIRSTGAFLSQAGFGPDRESMIRSALHGRPEPVDRVADSLVLRRLIPSGSGLLERS